MKNKLLIFILFFIFSLNVFSFEKLLFTPLLANPFEGRIGSIYESNPDRLRLDIGASFDLVDLSDNKDFKSRIGSDFFTFTRLRIQENMKFPVETSDYFFGINYSLKYSTENLNLSSRIRLSHISSHLVDGYSNFDDSTFWKKPFVYSREFVDIVLAIDSVNNYFGLGNSNLRLYTGMKYVFSTQPKNCQKIIPQIGLDYSYTLSKLIDFELGHDIIFSNEISDKIALRNSSQIGLNIKTSQKTGIFIGYYYYSGISLHGLFYKENDFYHGIGFQIFYF